MSFLKLVSKAFGILYVSAWSISFYPPLLLNYRLKSTEGLSVDFLALNIVGYIALVTSMSLFLFNPEVRQLYYDKHGYYPLLTSIDLIYSAHGFTMTLVTISQLFFWGFKKRSLVVKKITKIIIAGVFAVVFSLYYVVNANQVSQLNESNKLLTTLDIAIVLSYVKILMSVIKYIPQLAHNHKRKSVLGFSIFTIFLDFTGGILSTLQLFIDAYVATNTLNYDVLINNGGKLGLSFVTLFFDSCFFYQWWIFERNHQHHLKTSDDEIQSIRSEYREISS